MAWPKKTSLAPKLPSPPKAQAVDTRLNGPDVAVVPAKDIPRVNYSQTTMMEMACAFDLLECPVMYNRTRYTVVIDTGSSLNLMSYRQVYRLGMSQDVHPSKLYFKVADGSVSEARGEVRNVPLTFETLTFLITFAVLDECCHDLLLGTSFLQETLGQIQFGEKEATLKLSNGGERVEVPVTCLRKKPSMKAREMPGDSRPGSATSSELKPAKATVATVLSHFSTVLASKPFAPVAGLASADELTGISASPTSLELEIEAMVASQDGAGPMPGLFPPKSENEAFAPAVLSVESAMEYRQQDKSDWQILPMHFNRISLLYGPYSVDACADLAGTNAQVTTFWTKLTDCTKQDWSGHNAWCNPPFHNVDPIIKRFLECKKAAPSRTSATFILPCWEAASWWPLVMRYMRVVEYVAPWSHFFTASPTKDTDARRLMGPVRWPIVVVVCGARTLA